MSKIKVAVVIPVYKDELNDLEKISLNQVQKVLGSYPIIFIEPEGKNFSYIPENRQVVPLPAEYFKSVSGYNNLLLDAGFYQTFLECEYILIYQLDAFVFKDELKFFCSLNYDYIGASWPLMVVKEENIFGKKIKPRIGNGGFSLRKVQSCFDLLKKYKAEIENFENKVAEDVIFSAFGYYDENFKIAPMNIANKFSAELLPSRILKKNRGDIFFGCHAWNIYSADFWIETFKKFGYDLSLYKDKMISKDFQLLDNWKKIIVEIRLHKKILRGENISKYLQKNFYAAIYFLEAPASKHILDKLLAENKIAYNKIFQYKPNEGADLISDLLKAKKNVLVITSQINDDLLIISEFQKNNFKLKSNVELFHLEYLKICEKIFHNLGR